jgi:hypothetical protein
LLEVIDNRPPFLRIAPPFHGASSRSSHRRTPPILGVVAGDVQMAGEANERRSAGVGQQHRDRQRRCIIAKGADWFRSIGTADSPGTIVCTVTGACATPARVRGCDGYAAARGHRQRRGLQPDQRLRAVMVGVSSAVLTPAQLDTALSYEAMAAAGSSLGSAGFMVIAEETAAVSLAAGAARFLAIESCGQCTPCKQDGLEIARLLEGAAQGRGTPEELLTVRERLATVADGARCSLAQQQTVIGSVLSAFDAEIGASFERNAPPRTAPGSGPRRHRRPRGKGWTRHLPTSNRIDLRPGRQRQDARRTIHRPSPGRGRPRRQLESRSVHLLSCPTVGLGRTNPTVADEVQVHAHGLAAALKEAGTRGALARGLGRSWR